MSTTSTNPSKTHEGEKPSYWEGLSTESVERSRRIHGGNVLSERTRVPLWRKYLSKLSDPIVLILLFVLALSLGIACYHYRSGQEGSEAFFEPIGVLVTILLSTGIAFYFELRGEREFELLNQSHEEVLYKVYRSGKIVQVVKADLVVGDLVLLETGEQVPADAHLLESVALQLDESSLTGEPIVFKSHRPEDLDPEATFPTDHIYRGTSIIEGHCLCRITKVGDATEYGKIFEGIQIDSSVRTPLDDQLHRLSSIITKVSYAIATLVIGGAILLYPEEGYTSSGGIDQLFALDYLSQKLMVAITIIVVSVPEGLPMSVTLSLAYSMRRLMRANNLVRRLHACETMGASTVICTDKTGTLTQNKMRVVETHFAPQLKGGELLPLSMAINSTAHLDRTRAHTSVLGNPTEGALLLWLEDEGEDYQSYRERYPILEQLPFSTERKYMGTVIERDGELLLLVKGAPEVIMAHCSISSVEQEHYEALLASLQGRGMRTIGFAMARLREGERAFEGGQICPKLTWMGIVGIQDPIRDDVPEAIRSCLGAGIAVKIITGDTSLTAIEIARQIGLWDASYGEGSSISGEELSRLCDDEVKDRLPRLVVVSRAKPMDKERLVRLLQEMGEVVAVTGDGTNDAPALKRAQVGLSMGDGTSVAKEASDITILDNSFASITQAVMWGRSLHINIQRFILFQMTINVVACLIVLVGSLLSGDSPLSVTQMLWVNLIMDTFAALGLASLPPMQRVMEASPRKQTDSIISARMAWQILGVGFAMIGLLLSLLHYFGHIDLETEGFDPIGFVRSISHFGYGEGVVSGYELSVFFAVFVFLQVWNLFNAKAFASGASAFASLSKAKLFLLVVGIIVLGQIVLTTFGGELFRSIPLSLSSWLYIAGSTSLVLWLGELSRLLDRGKKKH